MTRVKGKFSPGTSGNPGGRPAGYTEVVKLAREGTAKNIKTLETIRDDVQAPHSARAFAANSLLDRGWGKAPQEIHLEGDLGVHGDPRDFTDAELATIAAGGLKGEDTIFATMVGLAGTKSEDDGDA